MALSILDAPNGCLPLNSSTKPEAVINLLGPPSNSWDDGVELCLSYFTSELSLRLYWDIKTAFGVRRFKYRQIEIEFEKLQFREKEPKH
jgi:hypothetical protein